MVRGAAVFRVVCSVIRGCPVVGTSGWADGAVVGTAVHIK